MGTTLLGQESEVAYSFVGCVRVVAVGNVDIDQLNNGDEEDGVTLATDDDILLAGQTDKTENGPYTVGATAGSTERHTSFDENADFAPGYLWQVREGDVYARSEWFVGSPAPIVVGTDDIEIFRTAYVQKDTLAEDVERKAITILGNGGNGSTLETLKGAQSYDGRIIGWEIVENAAAFEWAKAAAMTAPVVTRVADDGWAPPLKRYALGTTYLRSTTSGTVAAILVLYLARGDI
jgi:hypothetical protein